MGGDTSRGHMKTFRAGAGAIVIFLATNLWAGPVLWSGQSGIAPWDESLPPELRFTRQVLKATSLELVGDSLLAIDAHSQVDVQLYKSGIPIAANEDAAFQIELKMIEHDRPTADWGNEMRMTGLSTPTFSSILIARDQIAFPGFGSDSFFQSYP